MEACTYININFIYFFPPSSVTPVQGPATTDSSIARIGSHTGEFQFHLLEYKPGLSLCLSVIEDTFLLMKFQVLRDVTPPGCRYVQTSSTTFVRNVGSYLPFDKA